MVLGFWVQDAVMRHKLAQVSERVDAAVSVAIAERSRRCSALEAEVARLERAAASAG